MRPTRYLAAVAGLLASAVVLGSPAAAATAAPAVHGVTTTSVTPTETPEPTPTPGATPTGGTPTATATATKKKKASWKLRSEVNFNGAELPDGCVKYTGKYAAGTSAWSEKNATMKAGELRLKIEKKKTSKQPYTSGGIGCWNWPQTYGKFEIKAKVPAGAGINSYITLSPRSGDSANGLTSLELLAPDAATAYVSNGYGKGSEQAFSEQDFAAKFHTYTIEWAPQHLRILLDGQEVFWSEKSFKGSRWISMATTTGDSLTGKPTTATKLPKTFEITRMKIWKYTGEQPEPGQTLSVPVDDTVVGGTPGASATASPGASESPAATTAATGSGDDGGDKLIGGIWPWLIGGSVMVASALAILNYPNRRRQQQVPPPQPEQRYSRR